jgi:predicted O-methyltransferase YrrM
MESIDQIFKSFQTQTRDNINWKNSGDMSSRLDWIKDNFAGLDSITEIGTYQGCSTSAWLKCLPKKLTCIDIVKNLDDATFKNAATAAGIVFEYIISDCLKLEIDQTDLLFIDTIHTEEQVFKELLLHGEKANTYLAFHDVNPKKWTTKHGIDKWLAVTNTRWTVYFDDNSGDGFLVLKRDL